MTSCTTYQDAVHDFKDNPSYRSWAGLPFFRTRVADRVAADLDRRAALGHPVLPAPENVFHAFTCLALSDVRCVILGQDPYPTPGDAHGLAFSYAGKGRLPASLGNIFQEMAADLKLPRRTDGDLSQWAEQGVLLLNTSLTVEAGAAGAHLRFGWDRLAHEAVAAVSNACDHAVFILWGAKAQTKRVLIDETRHLVIASAHPSPLSARNGFFGSKPFSRTNLWLAEHGQETIDWTASAARSGI